MIRDGELDADCGAKQPAARRMAAQRRILKPPRRTQSKRRLLLAVVLVCMCIHRSPISCTTCARAPVGHTTSVQPPAVEPPPTPPSGGAAAEAQEPRREAAQGAHLVVGGPPLPPRGLLPGQRDGAPDPADDLVIARHLLHVEVLFPLGLGGADAAVRTAVPLRTGEGGWYG